VEAFLETTAVVDLLFKDRAARNPIQELLKKYEVKYSAQYVRMEVKRGVLSHFVYLHNKAVECKTFAEVQSSVSGLSSTPLKNKLSTVLKALEDFYREFEKTQLSEIEPTQRPAQFMKIMLAAFLRVRIKRFWSAFERLVDVVLDGAECYKRHIILMPPEYDGRVFDNTLSICDRFKPGICRIKDLCKENQTVLYSIHEALNREKTPDMETVRRTSAIKAVLRVPDRDILRKVCWQLGDAVIILEAPENSHIINGNPKHYDPLCKAAGKISASYRPISE
jgi:hypothetical protein